MAADLVAPNRVAEAGAHVEAAVTELRDGSEQGLVTVHARAVRVHADPAIVVAGTSHVDSVAWRPLIYSFRHYFGLDDRLGIARRADLQD